MWIKKCYYRECINNSVSVSLSKGVSFIELPDARKNLKRWTKWLQCCAFSPEDAVVDVKDICICSLHFVGLNGPTAEHPDPIMYEIDVQDIEPEDSEVKDVALNAINDQVRIKLEHSYASVCDIEQVVETASTLHIRIEKPFKGFDNAPGLQPLKISAGIEISESDLAKLSNTNPKCKRARSVRTYPPATKKWNPPATKKRRQQRKRGRRKSILLRKKSTVPKQSQRKISPSKSQEPFTFVGVKQKKHQSYVRNYCENMSNSEENFQIKEEIPDRADSDTVSLPSPQRCVDNFSDGEMESFYSDFSSGGFVRTTIVNECNLPDNPENDPLSLTLNDFDNEDDTFKNCSEHISNCNASAITFSIAPKEEPEDNFVLCPDLFCQEQIPPSEPVPTESPNTRCWSGFEHSSGFINDIHVKEENVDSASDTMESENFQHSSQHFSKEVPRSEMSEDQPGYHFFYDEVPASSCTNFPSFTSSTHEHRTVHQHSTLLGKYSSRSADMTTPIPNDAHCSASSLGNIICDKNNLGNVHIPRTDKDNFRQVRLNYSPEKCVQTNENDLLSSVPGSNAVFPNCRSSMKSQVEVIKCHAERGPTEIETDASAFNFRQNDSVLISARNVERVSERGKNNKTVAGTSSGSVHTPLRSKNDTFHCVQDVVPGSPLSVSFEGICSLSHSVQKKMLVSSAGAVSKPTETVQENVEGSSKSTKVSARNIQNVSQHLQKSMLQISPKTLEACAEASQNLLHDGKKESPKKYIQLQNGSKRNVICMIGKKIKTSPKLVYITPESKALILSRHGRKSIESLCKSELACAKNSHLLSQSVEEKVAQASPRKTTVPADGKCSSSQNSHPRNEVESNALVGEIALSPSDGVHEVPAERIQANSSQDVPLECTDKTVLQVDKPAVSVEIPNQSALGSQCFEVYSDSNLRLSNIQQNRYNAVTATSRLSNLLLHRHRYMSTVDKLNKRMRFLSRLKTILCNKNTYPYKL